MASELLDQSSQNHDRAAELKAFDDTKAGVKGLVDAGITSIPRIFIRPPEELAQEQNSDGAVHKELQVPVIDLRGYESADGRKEIVEEVRDVAEKWGIFQVVNHGIPLSVLEETIHGVRLFHEQDSEVKKEFYTRDPARNVRFVSNLDLLYSKTATWIDTLAVSMSGTGHLDEQKLPSVCRKSIMEHISQCKKLSKKMYELLSEALGLQPDRLHLMGCDKFSLLVGHYYPPCPEAELTMAAHKHTDSSVLNLLVQDQIGGLQVFQDGQWINVRPIHGAIVITIGNLLQIISNGKFKNALHRVKANLVGPRISVGCFFSAESKSGKSYGPVDELISETNPPRYKEVVMKEYMARVLHRSHLGESAIDCYKL